MSIRLSCKTTAHQSIVTVILLGSLLACSQSDTAPSVAVLAVTEDWHTVFRVVDSLPFPTDSANTIVRMSGLHARNGRIFIADASEGVVHVLARNARPSIIGRKGDGPGELREPRWARNDSNGNLYVAESQGRISVFDASDRFKRVFRPKGVTFISGFELVGNNLFILSQTADSAHLDSFDSLGTWQNRLWAHPRLPESRYGSDPVWQSVAMWMMTEGGGRAYLVSTLSDSIWNIGLAGGSAHATSLNFLGYVGPEVPSKKESLSPDRFAWIRRFYAASAPQASSTMVSVPFVKGVLNYADPNVTIFIDSLRSTAVRNMPPVVGSAGDTLLALKVSGSGEGGMLWITRVIPR